MVHCVEKNQSELFLEILRRLDKAGVLSKIILIGSWCLPIFRHYYSIESGLTVLRTRDIDFLVSRKIKVIEKVNLPKLLEDLGFIEDYKFPQGYVRLMHPELIMEFLVEEKGKGSEDPYPLPFLSMNAQKIRLLGMLEENTIRIDFNGIKVTVPHPINFGFHKLIIALRRNEEDKKEKDIEAGLSVLHMCLENESEKLLAELYEDIALKQKKSIITILRDKKEYELLELLEK
jgi:hypothetical protein